MSAGVYWGFESNSFCTLPSAAVSSFGFSSEAVNARNFLASAASAESDLSVTIFCIASRASLTFPKL